MMVLPRAVSAQTERCGTVFDPSFGQVTKCSVGIPIYSTPEQECQQWCWAACCEAIFGLADFRVDQLRFVEKLFGGGLDCRAATGPMIKNAIDGFWTDERGNSFWASAGIVMDTQFGIGTPNPLSVVWQELNAGRALITGTLGHAVLITALEYIHTPNGTQTTAVIVRDPWPFSPNRRALSMQEFQNVNFLATLHVS